MNIPAPSPAELSAALIGVVALLSILLLCVRVFRAFFPTKSVMESPVTREELESEMEKITERIDDLSKNTNEMSKSVARLESAVGVQNENFQNAVASLQRVTAQQNASIDKRLISIEENIRQ